MSEFALEELLAIATIKTLEVLFAEEGGSDAVALYFFYYKTAKKQKTNQVRATKSFCMKGLGWGEIRFVKASNILKKYNLIENIKSGENWYIKVNYIKGTAPQTKAVDLSPTTPQTQALGSEGTNALSKRSLNAYTLTNVRDDAPPKRGTSCPLDKNQVWHERYPKGHTECVEYVNSFKFVNKGKQFRFLHQMLRAGLDFPDIDKLIARIEKKPYFKENGYDFATIAGEADRSANAYS